jgi:hypothetical protein
MQRRRRILARLAISFCALLLCLVALEIGLRIAGWGARPARYFDSDMGMRFHGNQSRNTFGRDGPAVPFSVNEQGLRGPWYDGPKPPGVARVICLGDSFTFAWGLEDEHAYPLVLERLLDERLGPGRVQVANFGFSMFNTDSELKAYRKLGRSLQADVLVLGWYQNDVEPAAGGVRYTDNWFFDLFGKTALMEFFHYRVRRHLGLFNVERPPELMRRVREYQANFEQIENFPDSDLARPYWESGMADLRKLVTEVRADGVKVMVVVFPSRAQVERMQEARAQSPEQFAAALAGPVTAPQRRVAAALQYLDVPLLDLLVPLAECDQNPFGVIDTGHLGVLGCRVTAERVRDTLFELGWLPPAEPR